MPIYEYEGQRYDIATDDQAVAKQKILAHLGKAEAPAAEEKPAPTEPSRGIAAAQVPEVEGMTPEATKRRTGIADVLYNTIMSPIGLLGGVDVNAPEIKQDSPFFSALGKSVTRFKQSNALNEIAELENLRNIVDKKGALDTRPGTREEQLERLDKQILDKQRDLAEYGMETKAIEETFGKNKFTQKYDDLTASEAYKEASLPKQMAMTGELFVKNPLGVASYARDIGAENFLSAVPSIATAVAAKFAGFGTPGAAVAGGYSSAMNEFGNQYAELRAQGKSHEDAWVEAGVKSSVIGLFDAASFKSAGKAMDTIVSNAMKKAPLKETIKEVGKETGKQAGFGAAGEAGGSFAINQPIDLRNVLEEALGETVGAPAEAISTYGEKKAAATLPTDTSTFKPKFVVDPNTGNLVPVKEEPAETEVTPAAPLTSQGELFTKEEAPYQVTPGDVSVEAQARQEQSDRAAEQIVALKQQLAQTTDPQQVAAIRDDISKLELLVQETGQQKAIRLGDEMVTLYRKGTALAQQRTELEAARDAEKTLDGKKAITEQIKALEAQLDQVVARQEEISVEGKKLEKEGVTFDKTKDEIDLKGPSPIVNKKVLAKFGLAPKAPIRQELLNLDMTDPEDRQKFIDAVDKHTIKKAKIDMDAVEKYLSAFETPVQEEAPVEPSIRETGTGTSELGLPLPSGQLEATEGVTAPTAAGLAGNIPAVGGPVAGAGVVDETGQGALEPGVTYPAFGTAAQPRADGRPVLSEPTSLPVPTYTPSKAQTALQNDAIHDELTTNEKRVIAQHYGEDSYNDTAKNLFVQDVVRALNEGLDAVAEVLRGIIKRIQSGLLAGIIALNTANMSPPINLAIPAMDTKIEMVMAEVPVQAASKMSAGAKQAYGVLYPAMKQYLQENNKLFIMTDKPSARMFIFNPDGSLLLERKVLLGLATGDYYKGDTDYRANRITPAGLFNVAVRQNTTSSEGYDYNTVLGIDQIEDGSKFFVTTMHSVWMHERDNQQRMAALQTEGSADARMSFGCINIDKNTFGYLMENHLDQIDGAKTFIVPDDPSKTMEFISGEALESKDMVRERTEPVTKKVRTPITEAKAPMAPETPGTRREDFVTAAPVSGREGIVETDPTQASTIASVQRGGNVTGNASINLIDRISNGDLKGGLQEIVANREGIFSELEQEVARALLQSRRLPTVEVVDSLPDNASGQYDAATDTIKIVKGEVDSHSVLHESVHGFLHGAIQYFEDRVAKGLDVSKDFKRLKDIFDYLVNNHPELSEQYGMKSLSEFASEVMSNSQFQTVLNGIKYENSNSFTEFARRVFDLLGIKSGADSTVLAESLIAVQKLMPTGRAMQEKGMGAKAGIARILGSDYEINNSGILGLTESRIKSLFSDSAYTMDDAKAKGFIGYVNPQQFLDATRTYDEADRQESKENKPLDTKALAEESQHIFLTVEKADMFNDMLRITGHEGRHRMMALRDAGFTQVPVYFRFYQGEPRSIEKFFHMLPQRFGSESAIKGFMVNELIPINYDNYKLIKEKFSAKEGQIAYMKRTPTAEGKELLERLNKTGGMPPKPSFKFRFPKFRRDTQQLDDDYKQNSLWEDVKAGVVNMFSFDDAYNNVMRKELFKLSDEGKISQEQAILALRRVDVTQVVHRGQLATEAINIGKTVYDPITNRYRIEATKANMEALKRHILALSERTGITIDEALAVVSKAIEANRVRDVYEKLDKITGEITRTEKKIDLMQANRKRTKDEDKQLAKARELLKKLKDEQELNRDRVQHMTRAQVQEGMKDFNNLPETKEAFSVWMEMRQNVIDELVRSGVTSEAKAERWLSEMAYVPFFRDIGEQRGLGMQIMKKGLGESMAEYGFKGSMLPVENTIGNMYQWMHWSYARAISNQHLRVALDQMMAVYPDMIKEGPGPKGTTFSVYIDGQRKQYTVANPAVAKMFIETGSVLFPSVKLGKKYVELFVKGITRIPGFSTSQLILKDTWEAMSTSGVKNPYGIVKNVFFEIGKTALGISEARKELKARGTLSTREHAMASQYSTEMSQRLELKNPSYYRMVMNFLDRFSALNDNMLRQAVYEQLRAEGKSKDEAADRATEIFNYRRSSGSSLVQTLTNVVPFLNAFAISGRVAFRTVSGKGITAQTRLEGAKTLATTQTLLIAGTLLYLMAVGDSEEYERMNRMQRDTSFVIPGTNIVIPIRNGWFAMNKITAEYTYNLLLNEAVTDKQMFKEALWKAFKKQFEPPIGGVVVAPVGLALNKDIFNNKDIVNKTLDGLESEYQMDKNTSELAKYIGHISGMSPLKLDYFFNSFFGMAMPATAWMTNDLIAEARGVPRPSQTTLESISKIPTLGQFLAKEDKAGGAADFYAAARESDKSLRSIKKLAETDLGAAQRKEDEDRDKIAYTEGIKRALEGLNRRENIIRNTPTFTTVDGKRQPNTFVIEGEEVPVTSETKAKLIKDIEEQRKSLTRDIMMLRKEVFK